MYNVVRSMQPLAGEWGSTRICFLLLYPKPVYIPLTATKVYYVSLWLLQTTAPCKSVGSTDTHSITTIDGGTFYGRRE